MGGSKKVVSSTFEKTTDDYAYMSEEPGLSSRC